MNDYAEGFGLSEAYGSYYNDRLKDRGIGFEAGNELPVVRENKWVMFPLLCGLFNQSKFLPLRFSQALQIKIEVCNQ